MDWGEDFSLKKAEHKVHFLKHQHLALGRCFPVFFFFLFLLIPRMSAVNAEECIRNASAENGANRAGRLEEEDAKGLATTGAKALLACGDRANCLAY